MKHLDNLDRRILYELDCNSRQSISELARRIKRGRDQIEYRYDNLVGRKIIRKNVAVVNIFKLGFTLYKTYIRFENKKKRIAEFIVYLQQHPRIYWIALCDGGWDMTLVFFARNAYEFHDIHTKILSKFNDVVLNFSSYTIVSYNSFSRKHLGKLVGNTTQVGGAPEKILIDKIDYYILRLLANNSRLSAIDIGKHIGESNQLVRNRIETLEKKNILIGYRIELDLEKLGLLFFKTQFFLRDYDIALRNRLFNYCEKHPNVVAYIEQIGDCNIELELEVASYEQYAEIIDHIRSEYSKLIRNFQSMLIRKSNRYPVPEE
jgi:Lrp/AsnC family transcriptional regulator, leucine-responsive regulatory protein